MLDDDIEKRVLVNKDGSLSMEMKVRFRLLNDETLHCSTEIKKSSCSFNVSFPGQDNVYYPHCGHGESCSETESLSTSEADDVYITKFYQNHLEEPHCQHCCTHCQEYDIWKNPTISEHETLRHTGSSSSNASSHKMKYKKESINSVHTTSCEEYTEQVVEKATCIQQTVEEGDKGDNTVQYCSISRCCSRSEACSISTKAKKAGYTDENCGKNESMHTFSGDDQRSVSSKHLKQDQMSVQITQVSTEDERPLSVETNSSDILASLKEDEDKEETVFSPSNSRASQSNKENDKQTRNAIVSPYSFTPSKPLESPKQSLSTRTPSAISCCSVKLKTSRKFVVTETQENVDQDKNNTPSSTPHRCQHKEPTDVAIENGTSEERSEAINESEDVLNENYVLDIETGMRSLKSESDLSKTCDDVSDDTVENFQTNEKGRSSVMSTPPNPHADLIIANNYVAAEQEFVNMKDPIVGYASEEGNIKATSHAMTTDSDMSKCPIAKNKNEETADVTQEEKVASALPPTLNVSAKSNWSRLSEVLFKKRKKAELQKGERAQSVMSNSMASSISKESTVSELLANGSENQIEEVITCALSKVSGSSQTSDLETSELSEMEDQIEDRSPSIMSVKSSISEALSIKLLKVQSAESLTSTLSTKTNISVQSVTKISEGTPVDMDNRLLTEQVASAMSDKCDVSVRSKTSYILDISPHDSDVTEEETEDCAPSAKSNKSSISSKSNISKISTVSPEEADDVVKKERLKRPLSVTSSKSTASVRSTKSKQRAAEDDNTVEITKQLQDRYITSVMISEPCDSELSKKSKTPEATLDKFGDFEDNLEERAPSTMSTKSYASTKSNKSEMLEIGVGVKEERPLSAMSSKSSVSKKLEKCKISEAQREYDHPKERPASIMSSTSVKSKKSVVSDVSCENEEEFKQTGRRSQNALSVRSQRSRKSKTSEEPRQDTGNEENIKGAPSPMSCKSILSDSSHLAPNGVVKTGSTEDLLHETDSAYEETKDDRAASAMFSKSEMSCLSNKSKDLIQEKAPTSTSAKSNVSRESKNSKMDQSKDEGEEKHERASILASPNSNKSTRSKKTESLRVVSPAEVENQSAERTLSAMSGKSNTSKRSKNTGLDCFKEPKKANEEELLERSSTVSAKSKTSVRSKGSDTQSNKPVEKICLSTISPKSSASAKDEKSNFSIISNNSTNVDVIKSEETWDIKIEERAPSAMSAKSSVFSRSVKTNISALAGGQTDIESSNERSDSVLSDLKISATEISNNADNVEKASSVLSKKSNISSLHQTSERVLSPASASVSIGTIEEYDVNAEEDNSVSLSLVNSTPGLNSKTDVCCKDSSKTTENENQQCMETPGDRAKNSLTAGTIVSDKSKKSECTHKNSFQPITDNEVANNKSAKRKSKKSSSHSLSIRSAHSGVESSKTKDRNSPAVTDRPKSMSNTSLLLDVNGQYNNANAKHSVGKRSKSNLSNDRYSKKTTEEISRPHSANMPITSVSTDNSLLRQKYKEPVLSLSVSNHQSSSSNQNANKFNATKDLNVCGRTCNDSLVATNCSRNVNDNKSEKTSNSSCRHSSSSLAEKVDNNFSELVPSILPSSSPTEVVNEWLKKIPLDSALYDVGDEVHDSCEEELLKLSGKVMQYERGDGSERDADAAVLRPQHMQVGVEEIENNESKISDMTKTAKDLAVVENIRPGPSPDVPSSVQLMKILLSPKLDRCNSLPEVSSAYGRKLSTSARGLLESLVNLQLLDFEPNDVNGKAEKYNDLMNMLQSLWLCDSSEKVTTTQKSKLNNQQSNDEEFNVKSSSRVDNNSSLQDFGKSSVNDSTVAQKSQTNTEAGGIEILTMVQEIDKTENTFKGIETKSDSATPDIASRVRWTPENEEERNIQDSHILSAVSDLTIRNECSSREPPDTASISTKSSGNGSNDNQQLIDHEEDEEDKSSESLSSEQMVQLTEKVSQAPDPVWVLNLLSKIEKQFMTHYVTAMAEFKVRWNLNDNEQLDVMICELRDEVHKRIQASINNELRKIQGHAGRPRPPKETMSRESSILSERRRRRLKVNLSQSIDPAAKTDDDNTAILMTDFTDQQNDDDEYCPCDTCMYKKTLSRPVLAMEVSNSSPMMMDFDLKKILHLKRKAPSNSKENVKETENEEQHIDFGNLAENVLLGRFMKEKKKELYKANLELQAKSIEQKQNESDISNDKGVGKEYSQAVVGSKSQGVRKGSSSSSLEEHASETQLNKPEQMNNHCPMKEGNNTSKTLEQESPIADGEIWDHVELRNGTEILGMANADTTTEKAQNGPADMGTEAKITEDQEEICGEMAEGKWSVEDETVIEEHTIEEAGIAKKNMPIDAGTVGEQEVAEGESTEGKGTEVETSDAETGDETAEDKTLDKNESMRARTREDSEAAEGESSESEPEEGGETETTWKNMPVKPDTAVEAELTKGEAAEKEISTTATEKPKIKSEIIEDEKEAGHKSNGITHLEDGTDEDDTAEAKERESTDNEEREVSESAEEDIARKKINKERGEDDLFDEEKISKPREDGDISEHESAEGAYPMNDESAKGETDNDELDAEGKTNTAETAADKPADNETVENRDNFYDDTSDKTEIIKVKIAEDGETENVKTEDGETNGDKGADVGETDETKSAEDDDYESAEDAESCKSQAAEDTCDDEISEYGETPKAKITEDGMISDDTNAAADDDDEEDADADAEDEDADEDADEEDAADEDAAFSLSPL